MKKNVQIRVHDGVHWGDNKFILSPQGSIPTPYQYNTIRIKDISNQNNTVTVKLMGNY